MSETCAEFRSPVADPDQAQHLSSLGQEAIRKRSSGEGRELSDIEAELHKFVRQLYGIETDAELWVIR